jgi:hypothetical protein
MQKLLKSQNRVSQGLFRPLPPKNRACRSFCLICMNNPVLDKNHPNALAPLNLRSSPDSLPVNVIYDSYRVHLH